MKTAGRWCNTNLNLVRDTSDAHVNGGKYDFVPFIVKWGYLVQLFVIHEHILTAGVIVIKQSVKAHGPLVS